jgi:hypothetical protein
MAVPTYVASGTSSAGTTSPRTPTYPAGLAANDRLILQVFVRAENATCPTPSGWTFDFLDVVTGYGTQWVFSKLATGSESGSLSVAWTGTTSGFMAIAQIHAFRGVTTASRWYEPAQRSLTIGGTTGDMPTVITTGTDRLALALLAGANNVTVTNSTGESGGDWSEASEAGSTAGAGGTLQLQTADLASIATLSGGTVTFNTAPFGHVIRGLALIATTGTLAVGAGFVPAYAEATGATASNNTPIMLAANDILFASVIAQRDGGAVASFANAPVDSAGGSWSLLTQFIQGTAPSVRAAVFYRTPGPADWLETISFTTSGTAPDSLSVTFVTVSGGDAANLKFKTGTAAGLDLTVTLDNAPAASSTVLAFYGHRGTATLSATPTGFTQIYTNSIAPNLQRYTAFYDAISPVQSADFLGNSGTNNVTGVLIEVPLLVTTAGGTAAATRNRLLGDAAGSFSSPAGVITDPTDVTGTSTAGASHTSAPFTPAANGLVLVFGSARRNATTPSGVLGLSSTALTFTKVGEDASTGLNPTARLALFWAQAGPTPTSMTVTVTSSNADRTASNIVEIAANFSTSITNIGTGTNNAGDPAAALPDAPASSSVVLGCAAFAAGDATITHPFGTELVDNSGSTALSRNLCFQNGSGPSSASWTTGADGSVAMLVEIGSSGSAITGTGTATVNRLTGAATAVHATTGTGAATVNRLTGAASAVHGVTATAAGTRSQLLGSATATHSISGTAAATVPRLTGAAVAGHGLAGTAAAVRNPLSGTASGTIVAFIGDATATLGSLTGAATAFHTPFIGTATGAINRLVGAATGVHGVVGTAAGTVNQLTGTADATHFPAFGPAAATVNRLAGAATGTHLSFAGIGAGTLNPRTGAAAGVHGTVATAAATRNPLTGAATGVQAATGTAAATVNRLGGSAAGVHGLVGTAAAARNRLAGNAFGTHGAPVVFGNGAGVLTQLDGAAVAVHGVAATAAGTRNALTGAAVGLIPFAGTGAGSRNSLAGAASGVHGFGATAAGIRNALTGAAIATHIPFSGVGTGVLGPRTGTAVAVHGVVATAAGVRTQLAGQAVGFSSSAAGTGAGVLNRLVGAAIGQHSIGGPAAGVRNKLAGSASGAFYVSFAVGTGTGVRKPLAGHAVAVFGDVGTADAQLNQLEGHGLGLVGQLTFGEADATLNPLAGLAIGTFETPLAVIRYQECQLTGFRLTKNNARFDRERGAYILEDVLDDPEPPPRRPPTERRLR